MRRPLLLSLFLLPLCPAATMADPIAVTIDDPSIVATPSPFGITTVSVSGTLSLQAGYTLTRVVVYDAMNAAGTDGIDATAVPPIDLASANDGGTYRGPLFTLDLDPATPEGYYGSNPFAPDLAPEILFEATGPGGVTASGHATYCVEVLAPAAVPEPASLATLGIGAFMAALLGRRRGVRGDRPTPASNGHSQ